jgi:hypothetical protein
MTSGQRKVHKYIWLLLIIVVPAIMFFAIKDLNFNDSKNDMFTDDLTLTSLISNSIVKSAENEFIEADLYSNYIKIILKTPLKSSSATIHTSDLNGNKMKLLGTLDAVGVYHFETNENTTSIIIYDELKNALITKLDL